MQKSTSIPAFSKDSMTKSLVMPSNGKAITTSLMVAKVFGKEHKDVLKAIRNIDCSPEFTERNFAPCFYLKELRNNVTLKAPFYQMTRDGFTFLAMGFTGKVAARFKEAYIKAFNEMEKKLQASEKDREFAEAGRLLDMCVALLNEKIADAVKESKAKGRLYYDACGEVRRGIIYDPKADFRSKLANTFSQLLNAYLDAFYFINEMFESKEMLDKIKKTLRV